MSVHVCGAICGDALEEVARRPHGAVRWCFVCRAKRQFNFIVKAPVGMSYYGPSRSIRCATCETVDADLFPGREREWEDTYQ